MPPIPLMFIAGGAPPTPSVTPTPTITPTRSVTPTPTRTPTPTPTPSSSIPALRLYTWGYNSSSYGQLGHNDTVRRSSPVQVGALTNWQSAEMHSSTALAIKTDGTLWAWGSNGGGALGLGLNQFFDPRSSPVQVGALTTWSFVAAGLKGSAAIKTDGTLWTWGLNTSGQLGIGGTTSHSSPVQVGALTNWRMVVSSTNYGVLAIKTDNTLWGWGSRYRGQLGVSFGTRYESPVQIGGLSDWSIVSMGDKHSLMVKTDGTLWATGGGYPDGQLGNNAALNIYSPVQVGALTGWSKIAAGRKHSLAIKTDGTLWAWGSNQFGQLANNVTNSPKSSPVQIGALTTWSDVKAGMYSSIALKTDGTMWVWGSNSNGQLGLGFAGSPTYSPVQVGALTTWHKISSGAGSQSTMGITRN